MKDGLKKYLSERDKAVAADLDEFIKFANGRGQVFKTREQAELVQHKMRTAIQSLPLEMRDASKMWLTERGYRSLDF